MTNPSNLVYSRIPRPYLNVDGTPLVEAVCLKPCGDHVSKTSAAAFKDRCFCGGLVTSQEDDPGFQFYATVIHQNAVHEVTIAERNREIFSLKEQLKKEAEKAENADMKYRDLEARVNKYVALMTGDKSKTAETVSEAPKNIATAGIVPNEIPMQSELPLAPQSVVPESPKDTTASATLKPAAPKRKEIDQESTASDSPSTKSAKSDETVPSPSVVEAAIAVATLDTAKIPPVEEKVEGAKKPSKNDAIKPHKRLPKLKSSQHNKTQEKTLKPMTPKAAPLAKKPTANDVSTQLPPVKPAAPKRVASFVDFTSEFPTKKPPASSSESIPVGARSFAHITPVNSSVNPKSDEVASLQKSSLHSQKQVVEKQVVAQAVSTQDTSAIPKQIEGVISSTISEQTHSFFAAPAQITPRLSLAEAPEGIEQRTAIKSRVISVLSRILEKKPE